MKKTKLLVLGISSLLVLAGCGETTQSSSSETPTESSQTSQTNSNSSETPVSSESGSSGSSESSSEESSSSSSSEASSSSSDSSSEEISSSEEVKTYDIYLTTDDGATITNAPSKAEAGEEVHFTLTVLDGFSLKTIKAVSGTNEVALTVGLEGDYSFIMPKKGVEIVVTTKRNLYEVSVTDNAKFIDTITQKKVGSDEYVSLEKVTTTDTDDEGEEITSSYNAAEFGATVLVTLHTDVATYKMKGITVNGKAIELKDGETSFTFTMGHEKASISVTYDYAPVPVSVVNSEHFTLSLFKEDKVTPVVSSFTPYEELYVKATSSSEEYGIKALTYSYMNGNQNTETVDFLSSLEDGFYHFRMPYYQSGVTITVTEYNAHAYKDYAFVGEYTQVNFSYLSGTWDFDSFTSGASMTIDESGKIVYNRTETYKYDNYSIGSVNGDKDAGVISLAKDNSYSTATIDYDGNAIVFDAYFRESASSSNDIAIGYKHSDANATYTAKATQFKINSVTYALASFYKDGTLVENVLIQRGTKNVIHYGVEVTLLEGDYVSDAESVFTVKEGDSTLLKVGYTGKGGAANRVSLGDEYGDFVTTDSKTLHLDGAGNATYDGAAYSYTIADDEATITLKSNDKTIVGTIDLTAKTFTVTSEEENTGFPWYGKTYSGKSVYSAYDDDEQSTWTVVFHSNENKLDASSTFNSSWFKENGKDIDYSVADGTTITTKFYTAAWKTGFTVKMTYNASKDTFTVNGGVNADYFNNATFTLVA